MPKKLNLTEKKLKFHCSVCQITWQLLVIKNDLRTKEKTKCLNNCLEKWQSLLINYCQEQIILDLAKKEQEKEESSQDLVHWLDQIKKNNSQ